MGKKVFISYSSKDLQTADKVCTLLEAEGIRCWIAPRDVLPGTIYAEEIIKAIEATDALVLICSRYTSDSVHVRSEVEHAFSHKKVIFPVRMEDVELGKALEYFLSSSHWLAAWDPPLEECVKRLAESMKKVLAGEDETVGVEEPGGVAEPEESLAGSPVEEQVEHPNNLPAQTTRLIGREKEVAEVVQLLKREDVRLVTLTGPGGTGKTRLSLQSAGLLTGEYDSGVFFVPLAPIVDPDLVIPTIAQTLDVPEIPGLAMIDCLTNYLKNRSLLLVLDNFEQVISAGSDIAGLLESCSRLDVLVTSREVLNLSAERSHPVPPLALPEGFFEAGGRIATVADLAQYDAVKLFIDRAVAVNPQFAVTNENAPAVAEICHRLDGLPLAIELAVARMRSQTPQEMLGRLERALLFLTKGPRNLPARQQTLQATIAWSYDLLDESEKQVFRNSSVFAGGFTLEAIEHICSEIDGASPGPIDADPYDVLESLIDKSLIVRMESGGHSRFELLVTIREYGLVKLEENRETQVVRRCHATYYLAFAENAITGFFSKNQIHCLGKIQNEIDNIRASLVWHTRHSAESALRIALSLRFFWFMRGYGEEGMRWLCLSEEHKNAVPSELLVEAQAWAGLLAVTQGEYAKSEELLASALSVARETGDSKVAALSFYVQAYMPYYRGDYQRAVELFGDSMSFFGNSDEYWLKANSIRMVGHILGLLGKYEKSLELLSESLEMSRIRGDKFTIAWTLFSSASVALVQSEYNKVRSLCRESLILHREIGDKFGTTRTLEKLGMATALGGNQPERATLIFGALEGLRSDIGWQLPGTDRALYDRSLREVREALGEEGFTAVWQSGRAMTLNQVVEYVLEN